MPNEAKRAVDRDWFGHLRTSSIHSSLSWLAPLQEKVDRIVSFGCFTSEPYALLWILDASELFVIEIDDTQIAASIEEKDVLNKTCPESLRGREIEFICRDMSREIPELQNENFDLAYCGNVLYNIQDDQRKVMSSINQMIGLVSQRKWVIAFEPKFGVHFERMAGSLFDAKIEHGIPMNDPQDITHLFEELGLIHYPLDEAPEWSYCYQKP